MSRLPHSGHPSHSYLFVVCPYLMGLALASPSRRSSGLGAEEEGQGGGEVEGPHVSQTALTPAAGVEAVSLRPSGSASILDK